MATIYDVLKYEIGLTEEEIKQVLEALSED